MADPAVRRPWGRFALVLLLAGLAAGFYLAGLHRELSWHAVRERVDSWQATADANRPVALLIYAAVYVLVASLSIPVGATMTLVGGALFGRWVGTAVVSVASTIGATLAFLSSRYLLRDWAQARFAARLAAVNRGVERDGPFYLFTLRLIPLVPYWLVNLGMGLTRMRVPTFVAVSWAGMLPATVVYVNAGTELGQLRSPADVLSPGLLAAFALLGLLPLVGRWLTRAIGNDRASGRA